MIQQIIVSMLQLGFVLMCLLLGFGCFVLASGRMSDYYHFRKGGFFRNARQCAGDCALLMFAGFAFYGTASWYLTRMMM